MSVQAASSVPVSPRRAPGARWLALVLIFAAACLAYANSFHGPFVFDDESSITFNPTIHRLWPLSEPLSPPKVSVTVQGRPVLNLSLAVNYAIGGNRVESYHGLNLLIHAGAGLLLFGIVRRTLGLPRWPERLREASESIALLTALLWTVHPLQTESVTYVVQRAESLMGFFYLLTLYSFVRGATSGVSGGWWALAWVACVAGMGTKEVMATAPLMILFYDRCVLSGTFRAAVTRRRWLYVGLFSTWIFLGWLVWGAGGDRGGAVGFGVGISIWAYWATQFEAVVHYLSLTVWPHPLVFEYGTFWVEGLGEILIPAFVVIGLVGATVVALIRRPALGFLGAWFFGILAPSSLPPGTTQMIVEHRLYLSLAAPLLGLVLVGRALLPESARGLGRWLAGSVVLALFVLTASRNATYRSDVGLWQDTVAKRPNNPLAHYMLAGAWRSAGNTAAALASFEESLRLKPRFSAGQEQYGELLLREGRIPEAITHLTTAIEIRPDFADAHGNLGNALLAAGRKTEAVGHLETAVRLAPGFARSRYNFGNALAESGRLSEAVAEYQAAIRLEPGVAEFHFNLGNALAALNRNDEAATAFEAALQIRPDYAQAHYNLANLRAMNGRPAEAVPHYEAALRLQPNFVEALNNLGSALLELGRVDEAASRYEEALRLDPNFADAKANLDRLRARATPRH
jgi:tetratricopeptide (TPR) repeat protein